MKFPKPKKVKLGALKRKADTAFSKSLRSIINYCQAFGKVKCKCGGPLQLAHIEGRANHTLRFDPMAVLVLCAGHHRFFHSRPMVFIEFLLENYKSQFDYVMNNKNRITKMKAEDYQDIIDFYTQQHEQYESQSTL